VPAGGGAGRRSFKECRAAAAGRSRFHRRRSGAPPQRKSPGAPPSPPASASTELPHGSRTAPLASPCIPGNLSLVPLRETPVYWATPEDPQRDVFAACHNRHPSRLASLDIAHPLRAPGRRLRAAFEGHLVEAVRDLVLVLQQPV